MDEKENLNQTLQNSNLSDDKLDQENNLDTQPISDQDIEAKPLQSLNTEVNLGDISEEALPKEANVVIDQSIIDLNEELSNLSGENNEENLPGGIKIIKKPKEPIPETLTQTEDIIPAGVEIETNNLDNKKASPEEVDETVGQSISDLNKELSNLSSENIGDNLPKETEKTTDLETPVPEPLIQTENLIPPDAKIEIKPPIKQDPTLLDDSEEKETFIKPIKKVSTEEIKKENPIAIRTYRNDLAEVIKKKKVSLTDAFFAEENRKEKGSSMAFPTIKKSSRKKIYASILSLFLILSGVTFVFFVYFYKPIPMIKIDNVEVKSYIFSEYQREIFSGNLNSIKLTKLVETELNNISLPTGSLLHLYLTEEHQKEGGIVGRKIVNTQKLFSLLGSRASEILLSFVEPDFMYGYYFSFDSYPFLILKTRSFDNTFPEMLKWENNLIEDLRPIFIEDKPFIATNDLRIKEFKFKDVVINNKDTRAVLNDAGEIIFIYAFVDKDTIIITTNKRAFQEIFNRLTISYRER